MPYIKRGRRTELDDVVKLFDPLSTEGELNYLITKLVWKWLNVEEESYTNYNSAIGILECVKQELYRRKIADYEDKKKEENGDVF